MDSTTEHRALAQAIARVLTEVSLRERLRGAGRTLIAHHEWPCIAALHAQIYDDVLDEMSGGARELPPRGRGGLREKAKENVADGTI